MFEKGFARARLSGGSMQTYGPPIKRSSSKTSPTSTPTAASSSRRFLWAWAWIFLMSGQSYNSASPPAPASQIFGNALEERCASSLSMAVSKASHISSFYTGLLITLGASRSRSQPRGRGHNPGELNGNQTLLSSAVDYS